MSCLWCEAQFEMLANGVREGVRERDVPTEILRHLCLIWRAASASGHCLGWRWSGFAIVRWDPECAIRSGSLADGSQSSGRTVTARQ